MFSVFLSLMILHSWNEFLNLFLGLLFFWSLVIDFSAGRSLGWEEGENSIPFGKDLGNTQGIEVTGIWNYVIISDMEEVWVMVISTW